MEVRDKIQSFLTKRFLVDFDKKATCSTDLFKQGFIDSFGFIELVTFLENEFKIELTQDEIMSRSLNSVEQIEALVHRKVSK
ncbi:MAG: acyl carrier protein [Candidatus Obscuribacterales bacterium]|nr:acyl carrier protein [Candidatus Obscuribacterales bacterium]